MWGLDEYHFFPFVFGSSQLQGHPSIKPDSITKDDVLEAHGDEYMYLDAVRFVRRVKKGPLHETSPMLYDISGVPHWAKVRVCAYWSCMSVTLWCMCAPAVRSWAPAKILQDDWHMKCQTQGCHGAALRQLYKALTALAAALA